MISVLELFKIGVGPSSSHTVGPMKAAAAFADGLRKSSAIAHVAAVEATLFGSLAFTGKGHATDKAVILGLSGLSPETVDPDQADALTAEARETKRLRLAGARAIPFDPATAIIFDVLTPPPRHPNTLRLVARDADGAALADETWLSVGGGFIVRDGVDEGAGGSDAPVPYPFRSGAELLARGRESELSIAELIRANEAALRPAETVEAHVGKILDVMFACLERGLTRSGPPPGGLAVERRAKKNLRPPRRECPPQHSPGAPRSWTSSASTPWRSTRSTLLGAALSLVLTNGAAGVIPAVLRYYRDHCDGATRAGLADFLMTASAIGGLFKLNASISGAEVGCQGEVGVASSMAAAGLCASLGGSNAQIENAAEIAMEHHLGTTCDPVGGLVQIPCIERNAFGAVEGDRGRLACAARRRAPPGVARQRHQNHAPDRRRHAVEIQGDVARRPRGQFRRVLSGAVTAIW